MDNCKIYGSYDLGSGKELQLPEYVGDIEW